MVGAAMWHDRRPVRLLLLFALSSLLGSACATPHDGRTGPSSVDPAPGEVDAIRPGPARLPTGIDPLSYALELTIDPRSERFQGRGSIAIELARPGARLWLHAGKDMTIQSVRCVRGDLSVEGTVSPAAGPGAEPEAGEIMVRCAEIMPAGRMELAMRWDAPFDPRLAGPYRARTPGAEGGWYAYTQFEAMDARKAFPSFDEPRWKVPFRITLNIPSSMRGFSNTPVVQTLPQGEWTKLVFAETRPLPTYLVAWVVGAVDVVGIEPQALAAGLPPLQGITVAGRGEQVRPALEMAAEILPVLQDYFGRPYPYAKLDLAALSEFGAGAMENAGLITFREEALLVDPATSGERHLRGVASILTHELAHQWFGNLVTMPWWDDLWLNEAFATWMAAKVVDAWRPHYDKRIDLLGGKLWVFGEDVLEAARAVRNPVHSMADAEAAFDGLTYVKGASVLTMIERWIGEEAFQRGMRTYMDRHAWGGATAEDLFRALGEASGQDVASVASTFIERPGVPWVGAELVCGGAAPIVRLTQGRYRPLGSAAPEGLPGGEPWRIPVCVEWPAGEETRSACTLLDGPSGTLALEGTAQCPAWIHPNADEAGYYRWTLSDQGLLDLVGHRDALPRRARVGLLDQAWAMVAAGRLEPAAFLMAAEAMSHTADRQLGQQLLSAVGRVRGTWEELGGRPEFQAWVGRVLGPSAERLGWPPRPDESDDDTLLRPAVFGALARAGGDTRVLDRLTAAAHTYLRDPAGIPADVATVVMSEAARAGRLSFDDLRGLLERADAPAVRVNALRALGSLPAGRGLEEALALSLTDAVRAQDLRHVHGAAWGGDAAERRATLAFVGTRWDALVARLPTFGWGSASRMPERIGHFCDAAGRDAARALFEDKAPAQGARHLRLGLEKANLCIALRGARNVDLPPPGGAAPSTPTEENAP